MKLFDRLSDIERHVGCSIIIPDWYVGDHWLIFESDEPYTYRFIDYSADIDIHKNSDYSKDWLVLNPNAFYKTLMSNINMEKYIASYKHLIGCEYVGSWFNSLEGAKIWVFTQDKLEGFYIRHTPVLFVTDKDELVTYKEYMQLYYPEYEHIWSKQL